MTSPQEHKRLPRAAVRLWCSARTWRRVGLCAVAASLLLVGALVVDPAGVIVPVLFIVGHTPELEPAGALASGVTWSQGYFAVEALDDATVAFGEPRYWQQNVSYLLIGTERALLFDTGRGLADLCAAVRERTRLPLVIALSHVHFDHVGGLAAFGADGGSDACAGADVLALDVPAMRQLVGADGVVRLTPRAHLGPVERATAPQFTVARWVRDGDQIALGGRTVTVLSTPGHTAESLTLFDAARRQVFTGDTLYAGHLLVGDWESYLATIERFVALLPPDVVAYGGHAAATAEPWRTPRLGRQEFVALAERLRQLRAGPLIDREALGVVRVGERLALLVPFAPFGWGRALTPSRSAPP